MAAAVPAAWPRSAVVPMTRVELKAMWVVEMLRPKVARSSEVMLTFTWFV